MRLLRVTAAVLLLLAGFCGTAHATGRQADHQTGHQPGGEAGHQLANRPQQPAKQPGRQGQDQGAWYGQGPWHGQGQWHGQWRGTPVGLEPMPGELRLGGAGASWRVRYLSTSWDNRPTVVSGTLSVPRGRPPAGGWPVVSFGHGFGGLADACAQSRTGPSPWERTLEETLIGAGYAVAVSDWDGIGTPGENPGIEGRSEAYATIDIIRAARLIAPTARTWLSIGYSQGGHAALWASSLASAYAPELRLAGTIALAPVTQLGLLVSVAQDPAGPLNPTVPFGGRAFTVNHPDFRPAQWFTRQGLDLVDLAGRICIDAMAATVAGVTNADALLDPAAAAAEFGRLYAPQEIPLTGYTRPVRILHGTADTLPPIFSQITAGQLADAGVDATFQPIEGADHFTLLPAVAAQVVTLARDLRSGG